MSAAQDAAAQYIDFGWPVFRIKPNAKVPYDRWVNGDRSERATLDAYEAQRRWRHASFNIGIATGHPTRRFPDLFLTVLDLDTDEPSFAGRPEWAVDTYEVHTPNGGVHLYYYTHEPVKSGRIAPGVDVKSRGGMVVAPPSTINGASYVLASDRALQVLPADLFSPGHVLSSSHDAELAQPLAARMSFRPAGLVGEGGRDTYLAQYAGWWLRNAEDDYTASVVEGKPVQEPDEFGLAVELDYHNLMVCQPPLPERDVKRIARSIFAKHVRDSSGPAL